MRSFQLVRLALEAEGLRLSRMARRTLNRLAFGCFAVAMLFAAVIFGHAAAWFWLREYLAGQYVALIFVGADLLLAAIFALLAGRSTPGRVELEALDVRRRALHDAATSLTISTLLVRAVDWLVSSRTRR